MTTEVTATNLSSFVCIKNYLMMALEPVHVGAGGYRLGRVDNTIIREPATGLPKLPGTGLAGVARTYTAISVQAKYPGQENRQKFQRKILKYLDDGSFEKDEAGNPIYRFHSCAGKGGSEGEEHCGEPDCPVCIPYGFSKGKAKTSFQGLAGFTDARILLFPVTSSQGPVWITSPQVMQQFQTDNTGTTNSVPLPPAAIRTAAPSESQVVTGMVDATRPLNLGWLLFTNREKVSFALPQGGSPLPPQWAAIWERAVITPDWFFPRLVNDNLEVRTSVAIDPATGAAEEGALYTYEALPRGTILWFPVRYQNPIHFRLGQDQQEIALPREEMIEWVERGLELMEILGVGGKGSRGMGRLKCLNLRQGG